MAWRGLHISNPARLNYCNKQIVVVQGGDEDGVSFPVEDIAWIILDTSQVTVTGSILSAMAENGVVMVVPDAKHHPAGLLLPFHQHHAQAAIAQSQVAMTQPLKKRLWQKIIRSKIDNQAAVLRAIGCDYANALSAMADRVGSGDPDNIEAQAARAYWGRLFENFHRHHDDRRNALLNYGYAVVRAALARSCVASGLIPALGVHHRSRTNAFNLVDDLLELFRPVVDNLARKRPNSPDQHEMDLEDRRFMASVLNENVELGGDQVTVLAATELVTASLVRAIDSKDASSLISPCLPLVRRKTT